MLGNCTVGLLLKAFSVTVLAADPAAASVPAGVEEDTLKGKK